MQVELHVLSPDFVAEVRGIDLNDPLTAPQREALQDAFDRYPVLVFPTQAITYERQLALAAVFGRPSACGDITNLDAAGKIIDPDSADAKYAKGNALWHIDMSCLPTPPLAGLLHAREVPQAGGDTQFADLRAAWAQLPVETQERVATAKAEHTLGALRRRLGLAENRTEDSESFRQTVIHPLVRVHGATGQRNLFIGAHLARIVDWPESESARMIEHLFAFASADAFVYTHRWQVDDVLLWDNRRVMHRAGPYDAARHRRLLHRAEVLAQA